MQNLLNILKKEIFPISLIIILAFARLIPHPPNFTPIIAVAIISGYFFKNFNLSVLILLAAMLISDLFIGFYENIIFVYLSLIFITFIFHKISSNISFKNLFIQMSGLGNNTLSRFNVCYIIMLRFLTSNDFLFLYSYNRRWWTPKYVCVWTTYGNNWSSGSTY